MIEALLQLTGAQWVLLSLAVYGLYFVLAVIYEIVTMVRDNRRVVDGLSHYPGPKGHWLFGAMPDIVKNADRRNDYYLDVFKQYHDDRLTVVIPPPIFRDAAEVVTMDPALIKRMLHDEFDTYTKLTVMDNEISYFFKRWLGEGIFASPHGPAAPDQGALWRQQRKIAASIFTRNNFKNFMRNTFVEKGQQFIQIIDKHILSGNQEPLDMQKMFFSFTMDSIMKIFFARKTDTLSNKYDPFTEAFDESQRQLFKSLDNFQYFLLSRVAPWPFGGTFGVIMRLYRALNKHCIAFEKCCKKMDDIALEIVEERRANMDTLDTDSDLLALFMRATDSDGTPIHHPMYNKYLRDLIVNMIIAGRDTTACTLTWTFYLLSRNPKARQQLLEEIDRVAGTDEPTYETVAPSNMPYLQGCINEALRLYPPVPLDSKFCCRADKLPDGTVMPKGAILQFFPYGMGRYASQFEDPTCFKPERWQELGLNYMRTNQYEFPVFQAGYRICLGMDMAMMEAKILTVMLHQRFTFDMKKGENITYSRMITMSARNGPDSHQVLMIPRRRKEE